MPSGLRLGRAFGFPIAIHPSVLVIVLLLAWGLADGFLPSSVPGEARATYWLAGLAGALLLVLSLLAHELAHAVVARRAGVGVESLTLWMFGGVASLKGEASTPGDDFRIAAVGPAVSAALAVVAGGAWWVLETLGHDGVVAAVAAWLATVNLVLAVFNLVPGAPLDGGRVLRAYLWRRSGDRDSAAVAATRAGQFVASVLIAFGIVLLLGGDAVGGMWMALIGWFVLGAARAEREATTTAHLLRGVIVADVMSRDVQTRPAGLTVDELVRDVLGGHHSAYPVVGPDGSVTGLVTLAQLRGVPPAARTTTLLIDVALPLSRVATCGPELPVAALLPRLTPESGRRALVFDDGWLVGIVTPSDITHALESRQLVAPLGPVRALGPSTQSRSSLPAPLAAGKPGDEPS
ncbi:MAG TPA: site-2 protease family protein [Nocardioides sp.]|nr:site-2 protease family protein [Nocardioides sp.]